MTTYTIHQKLSQKKEVSTTVSEVLNTFTISPNPVNNTMTIKGVEQKLSSIEIYDLTGKMFKNENTYSFNVSTLDRGNYIIVARDLNQKVIGKQLFLKE